MEKCSSLSECESRPVCIWAGAVLKKNVAISEVACKFPPPFMLLFLPTCQSHDIVQLLCIIIFINLL